MGHRKNFLLVVHRDTSIACRADFLILTSDYMYCTYCIRTAVSPLLTHASSLSDRYSDHHGYMRKNLTISLIYSAGSIFYAHYSLFSFLLTELHFGWDRMVTQPRSHAGLILFPNLVSLCCDSFKFNFSKRR
jgi:hypothetical protein